MITDGEPRRTQSWEHLLEKDPYSGTGFRLGIAAALLIHAGIFAITWPIVAQAPPADPEPVLIPYPLTDFVRSEPDRPPPIEFEPPPPIDEGTIIVPGPPEEPVEPIERTMEESIEIPDGPIEYISNPIDLPPPVEVEPTTVLVGFDIAAPKIIEKIEPRYTESARHASIEGTVILDCIIDTAGRVESVTVLRGLPLGLTKNAVDAVKQWRFEASTYNNQPVSVRYILTVHFSLR